MCWYLSKKSRFHQGETDGWVSTMFPYHKLLLTDGHGLVSRQKIYKWDLVWYLYSIVVVDRECSQYMFRSTKGDFFLALFTQNIPCHVSLIYSILCIHMYWCYIFEHMGTKVFWDFETNHCLTVNKYDGSMNFIYFIYIRIKKYILNLGSFILINL